LRTLLKKPELAALVRELSLDPSCHHFSYHSGEKTRIGMQTRDVQLFCRAVHDLRITDTNNTTRWTDCIKARDCNSAISAILVLHTPNITSLGTSGYCCGWRPFGEYDYPAPKYWEAAIPRNDNFFAQKPFNIFSKLKEVQVSDIVMVQLASIMRLPALDKLTVCGLEHGNKDDLTLLQTLA
jgi:hypothetical protein